jgi:zinc finger SWIM domain-containing protein 3
MSFTSETDAYEMYNSYAGTVGFSIRKSDLKRRADKTIYSRVLVCSSQGHAEASSSHASIRTGCKALIKFGVSGEGVWTVENIELDHSHTKKEAHVEVPMKCYRCRQTTHCSNTRSWDEANISL